MFTKQSDYTPVVCHVKLFYLSWLTWRSVLKRDGQFMNQLVIFNYLLIRAVNSSYKCYELAVLVWFQMIMWPLQLMLLNLISKPVRFPAFLSLQRYLVGCSKTINPSTDYIPLKSPTQKYTTTGIPFVHWRFQDLLHLTRLSIGGSKISST